MTEAPPAVSDPTKEVSGEFKGQEDSERLPWKLPVIIGVPVVRRRRRILYLSTVVSSGISIIIN